MSFGIGGISAESDPELWTGVDKLLYLFGTIASTMKVYLEISIVFDDVIGEWKIISRVNDYRKFYFSSELTLCMK